MNYRQKAKDLMNLALDEAKGNEQERIAAAFRSLAIIREHDLLASPLEGIDLSGVTGLDKETTDAAVTIFKKVAGGIVAARKKKR
jgi:hypothetical protein